MKKVLQSGILLLAVIAFSSTAYSQGTIRFANDPRATVTDMTTGANAAAGTQVGLYISLVGGELTLGDTATIANPGFFNNGDVDTGLGVGSTVIVEIRAWDNPAANSYEEALALGVGSAGVSGILNEMNLGGSGAPAPNLITQGGMTSFAISPVPEPSTIALGILGGLGAMVLLRRRK